MSQAISRTINTDATGSTLVFLGNNVSETRAGFVLNGSQTGQISFPNFEDGAKLYSAGAGGLTLDAEGGGAIRMGVSSVEKIQVTDKGIRILETNEPPTPATGVMLFVNGGKLKVKDASGNVICLN